MGVYRLTAITGSPTLLIDDHVTLWDEYGGVVSISREKIKDFVEELRRALK